MKIVNHLIVLFVISLGVVSCDLMDNIDNIEPQNQQELENVMSDSASAQSLLRNVYQQWRAGSLREVRDHLSLSSGALFCPELNMLTSGMAFQSNNVLHDDQVTVDVYTDLYKVVNMANIVKNLLEEGKAPDLSEVRTEEMIAECRFHRAMAHFYLLRYFGQFYDTSSKYGVVVWEKPYPDYLVAIARATVEDVYTSVLKDLDYAIEKAPEYLSGDRHYYISRLTVKALKAKVLLCKGDYTNAESVAKSVLDDASRYGYDLESTYEEVFVNSFNSKEVLFAVYAYGINENYSASSIVNNTTYGSYTETIARLAFWAEWGYDYDMESGMGYDERFAYTYRADGPDVGGGIGGGENPVPEPEPEPEPWPDPLPEPDMLSADEGYMEPDGDSGDDWNPEAMRRNHKYPYVDMSSGAKGNTYFYLRLAEVYYIHAEAAVRNGHMEPARESLKTVMNFERIYFYPEDIDEVSDTEMLEFVRKNKWLELFAENNEEWFDLVRYHKAGNLNIADIKSSVTSDRQLIFPIPRTAMAGNNLLEQNP